MSGSIPASAGEPWSGRIPWLPNRVYPRECGGTPFPCCLFRPEGGLSPRVRGNHAEWWSHRHLRRSIPASAGEPPPARPQRLGHPVYPRECGGTFKNCATLLSSMGLSPRVRGNRDCHGALADVRRSIPASAGEPHTLTVTGDVIAVYPRECGGTDAEGGPMQFERGLSPRVRGNRRRDSSTDS